MPDTLVSVVMPTYNHGKYVGRAIDTVLGQTYREFELIVIDNHSEDDTESIVTARALKDSRIKYKKYNNHGIIAASRNEAIKTAQGSWLAFIDSDDLWYPRKLERVMQFLAADPSIDLVCHDEDHIAGQEERIVKKARYGPYTTYEELLFKGNSLSTSAVVVRKDCALSAGLFCEDPAMVTAEDYEFWMRLGKICHISYLHEFLGAWRIHEFSGSSNVDRHYRSLLHVVDIHLNAWPLNTPYYGYVKHKRRADVISAAGRVLVKEGKFNEAKPYLARALAVYPFCFKAWVFTLARMAQVRI